MTDARTDHRQLDPQRIVATLEQLHARVAARFPGSGLLTVIGDVVALGGATAERARRYAAPNVALRTAVAAALVIGVGGAAWIVAGLGAPALRTPGDVLGWAQGLESVVNLAVLSGGAVWFLLNWEARRRRARVLEALHELRSLAHVVDMHQLTKDPTLLLAGASLTAASPARTMSEFELTRYLDYCAETLALIAKLAALYAGAAPDTEIVEAANDLERLTSDLGRKIWQKITILSRLSERSR